MFLLNWYKEWLELKREYKAKPPCETCDALKIQVEQLRYDNNAMLNRLMEKPEPTEQVAPSPVDFKPIRTTRHMSWPVKRQMLEAEDREKAKLLKNAPKPADAVTEAKELAALEEEVGIAAKDRESQAS